MAYATTGDCVYPEYGVTSYTFSVGDYSAVGASEGTVTATDPSGGPVTYEIESGNEDGLFAIGESSGEVKVASDLTGKAGTTVELTVVAWSERRGGWAVPVEVAITE